MEIEWQLPALMYAEQLSAKAQATLKQNLGILAHQWERLEAPRKPGSLKAITTPNYPGPPTYSFRVGTDLRVILTLRDGKIVILDLVRNGQINKLRSILRRNQA